MPRPPRFFISPDQISGAGIVIAGQDVRHIATVLRMKTGSELILADGQGNEYSVRIVQVGKSEIKTEILSRSRRETAFPRIILAQGLPKFDKMDWIVQKATELGVTSIVPLITERTIVKLKDEEKRIVRWRKICREAAMQSNRSDIPQIDGIRSIAEFIQTPSPGTLALLPWEEAAEAIKTVIVQKPGVKTIIVLVGPEGGFSEKEADAAQQTGFHLVSLGPNILRTETAAVAALSIVAYEYRQPSIIK